MKKKKVKKIIKGGQSGGVILGGPPTNATAQGGVQVSYTWCKHLSITSQRGRQ